MKQRTIFFVLGILLLLTAWPIWWAPPFWDDFDVLFNSPLIQKARSPLDYWIYTTDFTKAWALGYGFFWLKYQLFGDSVLVYRALCLSLHAFNGWLIYKILSRGLGYFSFLAVAFFLFHPLQVETLSWTIQILTILSFSFAAAAVYYILQFKSESKNKFLLLAAVLLACSFLIKPGFLILAGLMFSFPQSHLSALDRFKKTGIIFALFCVTSSAAYYAFHMSQLGVELRPTEVRIKTLFPQPAPLVLKQDVWYDQSTQKNLIAQAQSALAISPLEKSALLMKNVGTSFLFYFSKSFFPSRHSLIYPEQVSNSTTLFLGLMLTVLFSVVAFLWLMTFQMHVKISENIWLLGFSAFLIIAGYLPFSGIVYIPHMKFSMVSDHWYYYQAFGYASLVATITKIGFESLQSSKTMQNSALAFSLIFVAYIYGKGFLQFRDFNNRTEYLQNNLKINDNAILRTLLSPTEKQSSWNFLNYK